MTTVIQVDESPTAARRSDPRAGPRSKSPRTSPAPRTDSASRAAPRLFGHGDSEKSHGHDKGSNTRCSSQHAGLRRASCLIEPGNEAATAVHYAGRTPGCKAKTASSSPFLPLSLSFGPAPGPPPLRDERSAETGPRAGHPGTGSRIAPGSPGPGPACWDRRRRRSRAEPPCQ